MNPASSLLAHLDSPVLVGDPDGKTVFMNPAFEQRFRMNLAESRGSPLANLFEGGGREAVLHAVARSSQELRSVRFRVRERGVGYAALASPIVVDGVGVGVILLLFQEAIEEERLLSFHREIQEPVEEITQYLEELFEQTGGRRAGRFREQVEAGLRSMQRLRHWTEELHATVTGRPAPGGGAGRFDAVQAVREAAAGVEREARSERREIELLLPAQLPSVPGDGERFTAALTSLLRDRLQRATCPILTVAAKAVGQGERAAVLVSVTEPASLEGGAGSEDAEIPSLVTDIVESLQGSLRITDDPVLGRSFSIRLPVAA